MPNPRRIGRFVWRWRSQETGVSAVEFALLLPVLLTLIFGMLAFGTALYNYEVLAGAVATGARQFGVSRGSTTPLSGARTLVTAAAPGLDASKLQLSFSINNTACSTDAACATALQNGLPASVTGSYPCNLSAMGINFAPGCQLSAATVVRVE